MPKHKKASTRLYPGPRYAVDNIAITIEVLKEYNSRLSHENARLKNLLQEEQQHNDELERGLREARRRFKELLNFAVSLQSAWTFFPELFALGNAALADLS
jgi:cell shape-determining protein MreC